MDSALRMPLAKEAPPVTIGQNKGPAVEIDSIEAFLSYAYAYGNYVCMQRGRWVFRGHWDAQYKLIPSVGRDKLSPKQNRKRYEKNLLNIFRREAPIQLTVPPNNEWDWLSLAQHHGLLLVCSIGHITRSPDEGCQLCDKFSREVG